MSSNGGGGADVKLGGSVSAPADASTGVPADARTMNSAQRDALFDVIGMVVLERQRQHDRWGEQNHPDGTGGRTTYLAAHRARKTCTKAFDAGHGTWRHILAEEVAEAFAECDPEKLKAELLQAAAVCVQWVEAIGRRREG